MDFGEVLLYSLSDEQSESTTKSLRGGASLQKSVTVSDPHARERAMSTGADGSRPVPLPRRIKKGVSVQLHAELS